MGCLFGLIDYGDVFTRRERERIIRVLSVESQQRGTDATGIAYLKSVSVTICKRPLPASRMWFHFPSDANIVMGHTRMTTQGNEKKNYNNHPFKGACGETTFALAHNGVLHNDWALRRSLNLPTTKIETDSYVAVQLLERNKALNFTAIKDMAETVEGSFCFSILDSRKRLFLVKGDNPLTVYKFTDGFYLYASTEEILKRAIWKMGLSSCPYESIALKNGDILCIKPNGKIERETFENYSYCYYHFPSMNDSCSGIDFDEEYIAELKEVAGTFGYTPEDVDSLLADGFTPEEIEEFFYSECPTYDRLRNDCQQS